MYDLSIGILLVLIVGFIIGYKTKDELTKNKRRYK